MTASICRQAGDVCWFKQVRGERWRSYGHISRVRVVVRSVFSRLAPKRKIFYRITSDKSPNLASFETSELIRTQKAHQKAMKLDLGLLAEAPRSRAGDHRRPRKLEGC